MSEELHRQRGRPRAFDRTEALRAATRLFWTKGYEATAISELTAAMGIGAPSLYAAFLSKEALYAEALDYYVEENDHLAWTGFRSARTAREAVAAFLMDSAAALTGSIEDVPRGCMVTLSSVDQEKHAELAEFVRMARTAMFKRIFERLAQDVENGAVPKHADIEKIARFVQTVQSGMSILARDGASRSDLEAVARMAVLTTDALLLNEPK